MPVFFLSEAMTVLDFIQLAIMVLEILPFAYFMRHLKVYFTLIPCRNDIFLSVKSNMFWVILNFIPLKMNKYVKLKKPAPKN